MMREGKELILATKPFAREIRWKSWYLTITSFLLLIGGIAGTILLPYLALRILSGLFTAGMLARVFIIYHDYQHHTILQKSRLAKVLFTIFGVYMITPPSIWKRSHDHHHSNNSKLFSASIGSYPIMTRQKYEAASKGEQRAYRAVRHPLTMIFAYFTMFLYGMCLQSFFSSPKRHWDSLVIFIVHVSIAVYLFVAMGWLVWFLAFFLPFFLSHMLGAYLFYAQHNFVGVKFRINSDWNYSKAALESSSFMKLNRVLNWITANIGYHHIHHMNARIPFYRLPETMKAIPELQQVKHTSLNPVEIYRCLKLAVWDPEQDRMLRISELK